MHFVEDLGIRIIGGCCGTTPSHIKQLVELANEVYTPPESEVSHAKQILIALDEAAKEGRGAAQLNGRMIDAASAKMAENIVNTDKAINAKLKG